MKLALLLFAVVVSSGPVRAQAPVCLFWEEVGGGLTHTGNPAAWALATYDDGSGAALVAGGSFDVAGVVQARSIARAVPCSAPLAYCTAKVNSAGCLPSIAWSGCASASVPVPFDVRAEQVVNGRLGLLSYGPSANNAPFFGGTACVGSARRWAFQNSGGSAKPANDCTGALTADFNARIQSGVDPSLVAGARVFAQYLYRDPLAASGVGSTDAIDFVIHP